MKKSFTIGANPRSLLLIGILDVELPPRDHRPWHDVRAAVYSRELADVADAPCP